MCASVSASLSSPLVSITLSEAESKQLLARHGVAMAPECEVQDVEAAVVAAVKIGLPVVVKLCGPAIAHKTERNLVRLGLATETAVREAASSLLDLATSGDGDVTLLVAKMVRGNRELIAGLTTDPQFGVAVMRHNYEYLQWLAFSGMSGISTIAQRDLNVLIAIRKTAEEAQKDARRNGGDAVIKPSRVRHHLPKDRKADSGASAALFGEFATMGKVVERSSRRGSSFAISLGFFAYLDEQIALLRTG